VSPNSPPGRLFQDNAMAKKTKTRDYYTAKRVGKLLHVTEKTARENGKRGKIPGLFQVGGRYRFRKQDVDQYLLSLEGL
jgi:excisionase family DNA binding protein